MKTAATVYLGLSLIGVAVFGFLILGCQGIDCGHFANKHLLCIASKIQAADCPETVNVIGFTNFHLGALKSLSAAAANTSSAIAFLWTVLALAAAALILTSPKEIKNIFTGLLPTGEREKLKILPVECELTRWLALREKRDPRYAL